MPGTITRRGAAVPLEDRLATRLIEEHPLEAAAALERVGLAAAARFLARLPAPRAARLLRHLSPTYGSSALSQLPADAAAAVLAELAADVAARLLRPIQPELVEQILDGLPPPRARSVRRVLRFPAHSAGAVMDPEVMALAADVAVAEALRAIRREPERARYNLYVVDREQRLVGALNLRELFLARPSLALERIMVRDPYRVPALADRAAVLSHPGWQVVHSLPVVDEQNAYLGAIRYQTFRALERELRGSPPRDADTGEALGELFAAGATALFDALTGARTHRMG